MIEVGFYVLRVVHIAMEAFAVILPDQLPIGVDLKIHDLGNFGARDALWHGDRGNRLISGFKVYRDLSQADEDQPLHLAGMGRVQPELGFVQIGLHAPLEQQMASAVIGPLVIGADESFYIALRLLADDRSAVTTDIIQSIYLTIVSADHNDRIPIHFIEEIVARIGDLAGMAGEEPALPPDGFHFELIKQFVMIERARQAMTGLAGVHQIL